MMAATSGLAELNRNAASSAFAKSILLPTPTGQSRQLIVMSPEPIPMPRALPSIGDEGSHQWLKRVEVAAGRAQPLLQNGS
jgi:hypothetical protein